MQLNDFKFSDFIGIWGAITGTISLAWIIYHDRSIIQLRYECLYTYEQNSKTGNICVSGLKLIITNHGKRPVKIEYAAVIWKGKRISEEILSLMHDTTNSNKILNEENPSIIFTLNIHKPDIKKIKYFYIIDAKGRRHKLYPNNMLNNIWYRLWKR